MPTIRFSPNFERHVDCPEEVVDGTTVRAALDAYFAMHPGVRGYVLDDRGKVREHIAVFVGGATMRDRTELGEGVPADAVIDVFQALSGG